MMTGFPNLSGQQDVYAGTTPVRRATARGPSVSPEISELTLVLERSPGALLRVFGVLCTFDLVPVEALSGPDGPDTVWMVFRFDGLPRARLDLLTRKLAQLTECFEVSVAEPAGAVAIRA